MSSPSPLPLSSPSPLTSSSPSFLPGHRPHPRMLSLHSQPPTFVSCAAPQRARLRAPQPLERHRLGRLALSSPTRRRPGGPFSNVLQHVHRVPSLQQRARAQGSFPLWHTATVAPSLRLLHPTASLPSLPSRLASHPRPFPTYFHPRPFHLRPTRACPSRPAQPTYVWCGKRRTYRAIGARPPNDVSRYRGQTPNDVSRFKLLGRLINRMTPTMGWMTRTISCAGYGQMCDSG